MPLRLRCPGCTTLMRVPDNSRGKRVKCPGCEQHIRIPKSRDSQSEHPAPKAATTPSPSEQTSGENQSESAESNREPAQMQRDADPRHTQSSSRRWFLIGGGLIGLTIASAIAYFAGLLDADLPSNTVVHNNAVAPDSQIRADDSQSETPPNVTLPATASTEPDVTESPSSESPPTEASLPEKTPPTQRASGSVAAFNAVHRSVVNFENRMGNGTGIILNRNGLILTNAHVIEGPTAFICRLDALQNGEQQTLTYRKVSVVGVHPGRDLALVKIDTNEHDAELQPARIEWKKAVSGEKVFAIGNPSTLGDVTLSKTITEGLISGVDRRVEGRTYYQISAPINPGNSGGPVTNQFGDVLGVVTLSMLFASDVGFAIPLHDLDLSRFVPPKTRKGNRQLSDIMTDGGVKIQQSYYSLVAKKLHKTPGGRINLSLSMRQFQNAVATDPTNWRPYLFIGRLLASQGKYTDAEGYLRQSLELDPWNNISSYEALGRVMDDGGYPERALPIWQEGVARFPLSGGEIWGSLARYHAVEKDYKESALCAAAALYSMHSVKRVQGHAQLTQLLESMLAGIKDPEQTQRIRNACYGIDAVVNRLNDIAKPCSKSRIIAMRQNFFETAQQMGLELRGGPDGATPGTKPLPNGLLEYPPPGVERITDIAGAFNSNTKAPTPETFPTAPGESIFNATVISTIANLDAISTDKPQWMTPPKVVASAGPSGSPKGPPSRPGIAPSTPAPTTSVEPIVAQVSPIAQRDVSEFRLSPDGNHLVVVDNYKIYAWDRAGQVKWQLFDGHERARNVVAFSNDGKVATSDSRQTLIWDLKTHEVQQSIGERCEFAAFMTDNQSLLTVGSRVDLWSCKNGQRLKEFRTRFTPYGIGLAEDDSTFSAIGSMGQFGMVNIADGKPVTQWKLKGNGFSRGFIVDHGKLAIVIHIKLVQIADTKSGKIIFRHNFEESISGCAATPDGNTVVFTQPNRAMILDFSDRTKPRWIAAPYGKRAYHGPKCSLSSDGKVMATTAREQKAIEIWDMDTMLKQSPSRPPNPE